MIADRAVVMRCPIDRLDMATTVARCVETVEARRFAQHMAINAAKLVTFTQDAELRAIVDGCTIVSADGQSVIWASRILGDPLPERVTGIDLMLELLEVAARRGFGVFFLGARRDVLERAVARLRRDHPGLRIAGYRDGYFDDGDVEDVCAEIRAAEADMLFVAMSSPRKELFLGRYGSSLGVPFVMGIGGALDVVAGVVRRAPRPVQALGLEWLYRLAQEPARLGPRYVRTNSHFVWLVAHEWLRRWAAAHVPLHRSVAR